MSFVVLDPSPARRGIEQPAAERPLVLVAPPKLDARLRVALFSNSKANVDHLFAGLDERLRERSGISNIGWFDKGMSTRPVAREMLDEIARNFDLLITASAD